MSYKYSAVLTALTRSSYRHLSLIPLASIRSAVLTALSNNFDDQSFGRHTEHYESLTAAVADEFQNSMHDREAQRVHDREAQREISMGSMVAR